MAGVAIVAKLTAADGKAEALKAVIADLVAAVDSSEPDTVVYAAAQDNEDPSVFWFYEYYGSEDAAATHANGAALAHARSNMRGLLSAREVHALTPIAGKGLPA